MIAKWNYQDLLASFGNLRVERGEMLSVKVSMNFPLIVRAGGHNVIELTFSYVLISI